LRLRGHSSISLAVGAMLNARYGKELHYQQNSIALVEIARRAIDQTKISRLSSLQERGLLAQ
jgi:hypothetical protein